VDGTRSGTNPTAGLGISIFCHKRVGWLRGYAGGLGRGGGADSNPDRNTEVSNVTQPYDGRDLAEVRHALEKFCDSL
jgi:hypothetical protein